MNSTGSSSFKAYTDGLRAKLSRGDNATQAHLDAIVAQAERNRESQGPRGSKEILELVKSDGSPLNLVAPRWLCHLLGLRHACSHVILSWQSPAMGTVFILQVRSWNKSDSPGHVDVSVGGHIKLRCSATETAYVEMEQELGIARRDLDHGTLRHMGGYESFNERPEEAFYNAEWREVYVGGIAPETLTRIQFRDREVAGLYLCPETEARNLLDQRHLPLTSSLMLSLPMCLRNT
jgi:hypothetical protein